MCNHVSSEVFYHRYESDDTVLCICIDCCVWELSHQVASYQTLLKTKLKSCSHFRGLFQSCESSMSSLNCDVSFYLSHQVSHVFTQTVWFMGTGPGATCLFFSRQWAQPWQTAGAESVFADGMNVLICVIVRGHVLLFRPHSISQSERGMYGIFFEVILKVQLCLRLQWCYL